MGFFKTLKVLALALSRLALMAKDSCLDLFGNDLDYRPAKFLQAQRLEDFLNRYTLLDLQQPVRLDQVTLLDIESISSNCKNVVVEIDAGTDSELPTTLFIKLPAPSLLTRWFISVIGVWELEVYFFHHVAARVPIRTPVTYAATARGSRFALVQENLYADPTVQLFTNLDMAKGPSLELVRRCLDTFAKLHASHHGLSERQRDAILPMSRHLFLTEPMKSVSHSLNAQALQPCIKKLPGVIPDELIAAYKKSIQNWDLLLGQWFSGPLMLIHGDSHLGNFFVDGDNMGMLDWQAVHWGKGVRDVQYFLIDSLPLDILQEHEQDLLQYYVNRLAAYGVELAVEEAWQQYRGFTFHTLMTIVVSIGFGAMSKQQNQLMAEILKRAVAAQQRADYPAWLDEVTSTASSTAV